MKILVTGGSGFIGTNLINLLEEKSFSICNIDINSPKKASHEKYFSEVDINDYDNLFEVVKNFDPDYIVHLAAKTDLDGNNLDYYKSNIIGVKNILKCCSKLNSIKRIILASTKLIVPTDFKVNDLNSYNPDTIYGDSKALGEQIVEQNKDINNWIIVRPTSIWGPWSLAEHIPYGRFFQIIKKGLYVHPEIVNKPRYFGYVENSCYQIYELLINAPDKALRKKFYLADYEVYDIKSWANLISSAFKKGRVKTLPKTLVYIAAYTGDMMKFFGFKEPPFSSFRLKNMISDTTKIPLEDIQKLVPNLPYSISDGVKVTVDWINKNG